MKNGKILMFFSVYNIYTKERKKNDPPPLYLR